MAKTTVGVYAFVTPNWKELDYPLDLWLEWHTKQFDAVSLVTWGDVELPIHSKINLDALHIYHIYGKPDYNDKLAFAALKQIAQRKLKTDWKIMLDIDEFIYRPTLNEFDMNYVYMAYYYHLWGNLHTRIINEKFPMYQRRMHYGYAPVDTKTNANVEGRYDVSRVIYIYHTNCVRNPYALAKKWKLEQDRLGENFHDVNGYKEGMKYDYTSYYKNFEHAQLEPINPTKLPAILIQNQHRFWWME